MLDSLVRVSRRVNENHFVSILERAIWCTRGQRRPPATRRALLDARPGPPGPRGPSQAHADAPCGSPRSEPRWASPGAVTGTTAVRPAPYLPRGLLPRREIQPMLTRTATQDPPPALVANPTPVRRDTAPGPPRAGDSKDVAVQSLVSIASFLAISSTF